MDTAQVEQYLDKHQIQQLTEAAVNSAIAASAADPFAHMVMEFKKNKTDMPAPGQSLFAAVKMGPPDPILGVTDAFKKDDHPDKMNLGVGAYRDEAGKPWVLDTVKQAEADILADVNDGKSNKEYLPIDGMADYTAKAVELLLGDKSTARDEGRLVSMQCLSGTGGLRLVAACMGNFMPGAPLYLPNPTWGNHKKIFPQEGVAVKEYAYYHPETCGLDFEGMCADMQKMPAGSVILLHACAHNPTGVDPTQEQWKKIAEIVVAGGLVPLFDSAYQGFASGDFDQDAWATRYFAELPGMEMFLAQSFAKNMGLYGERIGTFSIIVKDAAVVPALKSQVKPFIRTMYSSPPMHGAQIALKILENPERTAAWKEEVKIMADRIILMRKLLFEALQENGCPGTWNHIVDQIGMFSFTGLTKPQVEYMWENWHIYFTKDGRISMAGLRTDKIKYMADAMKDAIEKVPK